jgi:hypothetical protein
MRMKFTNQLAIDSQTFWQLTSKIVDASIVSFGGMGNWYGLLKRKLEKEKLAQ